MELSIAHADVIAATRRGFAFLLANGLGWWIVGALAFRWPVQRVATLLLFMGAVTMPLAFALGPWSSGRHWWGPRSYCGEPACI